jgi:hypothetical protein
VLDLRANGRVLQVNTAVPFTLIFRTSELTLQKAIPVGSTELPLD